MAMNLTSEQIDAPSIAPSAPSMTTSWQRAIRACHLTPFIFVNIIDEKVVKKCCESSVEKLSPEKEEFLDV